MSTRGLKLGICQLLSVLCVGGCDNKAPTQVVAPTGVAVVVVAPGSVGINVGGTTQLQASALTAAGQPVNGAAFAWSSSAPAVAGVSPSGLVTGIAPGEAQITATSGSVQGQAAVTVTAQGGGGGGGGGGEQGNIVVNTSSPQQVMAGWEATAQAGQGKPTYPLYRDTLLTLAAELGIDRLRMEVRSGTENPTDNWVLYQRGQLTEATFKCPSYTVVNDDSDPNHINAAGFHFSQVDSTVEQLILPYRAKLAALGRRLQVNANYVAFTSSCGAVANTHKDPQEYAELALALFQHMQQRYGFVPDYWEMILEPDTNTPFTGSAQLIGQALVATAARLAAAGFHPKFIAPSTTAAGNAAPYFNQLATVPGAAALVGQISYHRYGSTATQAVLTGIGQLAQQYGTQTAMLEHIGATYQELHDDLKLARVSSWHQYTLAYPTTDNGAQYFAVDVTNPSRPLVLTGSRTKFLRQYFRWVRPGALRVDASSSLAAADPVAFVNSDGRAVVVVRTTGAADLKVQGLPAGSYGVRYTTGSAADVALPDQAINAGQLLQATMPAAGVITFFAK